MDTVDPQKHVLSTFHPSGAVTAQANVRGIDGYNKLCAEAASDYEGFWARLARESLDWHKPFASCLDRNIKNGLGDKTAIIFEAAAQGDCRRSAGAGRLHDDETRNRLQAHRR